MTPPPLPANELYRLFTLKRLHLESASVLPFLNSIVQIAHDVFDVPVAFVSAVESERQCFIAKIGLDVETSDREISICGHVVGTGSALLIPDTRLDPRFADNPFVTATEKPIIFLCRTTHSLIK
jgi:GAF domain-containing protein